MTLEEAKKIICELDSGSGFFGSDYEAGFSDALNRVLGILDEVDTEPVGNPDKLTLEELARELRKIFIFKYLTVEFSNYNGCFVTWDEKPNWDGRYWCDEDGAVLSNVVFSFAGVDIIWEIDLSEYKDKAGEIDYSRCIVEVG